MAEQRKYNKQAQSSNEIIAALGQNIGVTPPQAIDLEEAVLGALMIEKHAILSVQDILVPQSFYKDTHQTIYRAILELSAKIEPIDLYTVGQQLQRAGKLPEIGGASYLAQLTQKVGSAAHIEYHSKIVAQKYVQRELIRASTEIQKRSFEEESDVLELINFAEGEIFKVAEGNVKRDVQAAREIVQKTIKQIEEAATKPDGLSGVPSGFTDLDRLTLGWQQSDMVVIAARPSMGKTAFVLNMARNVSVGYNRGVAFFSLEMSSVQLMTRLIVAESGLDSRSIKNGRLSTDQWAHLENSIKPLANAPLFIDDTPALSIFEFRSKARRLKAQHNIELIIIDYLQLMTAGTDMARGGNREQEVSTISRSLKAIAKELDVPIIALSQLSRAVESRGGLKRPQLSDLRESGAIEQDADLVAFIHRPEYYGLLVDEAGVSTAGLAEIIVAKHRNGPVDTVRLRFRSEQAKFVDYDDTGFATIDSSMNSMVEAASGAAGFDSGGFGGGGGFDNSDAPF